MKYLPWGLLLLVMVFGYGRYRQTMGEMEGRIKHLTEQRARVDTLYRTDTMTLSRVRRLTDTLRLSDTVRILIAAERQACDAVISTCEQRVAYRDSIITVLKKKPSVWSKLPWVAAGVLGGVILSK